MKKLILAFLIICAVAPMAYGQNYVAPKIDKDLDNIGVFNSSGETDSEICITGTGNSINAKDCTDQFELQVNDITVVSLSDSGNVGIGVIDATKNLVIQDSSLVGIMAFTDGTRVHNIGRASNFISGSGSSDLGISSHASTNIIFGISTLEAARISPLGYFSLNDATPDAQFDIDGQDSSDDIVNISPFGNADAFRMLSDGSLTMSENLTVDGGLWCSKITAAATDPDLLTMNKMTREKIVPFIYEMIPLDKINGMQIFYNEETNLLEAYLPEFDQFITFESSNVGDVILGIKEKADKMNLLFAVLIALLFVWNLTLTIRRKK